MILYALGDLINAGNEAEREFAELTSSFKCKHDKDIENFLYDRAFSFEKLHKSRTYLLLDENSIENAEYIDVLGFFSVALKVLDIPESISNSKRKKLDGFSAKMHGEPVKSIPCYLIGQLAKNSDSVSAVRGAEILETAVSIIKKSAKYVGGRYVMIECRDNPYLRKFYTENGFEEFDTIPDDDIPVVQMIRPLYPD